ncbi:MAG: hypothetical protein GW855_12560 [Erythrobacter sp.]|nr:hypothetical protein [Erythrobacter sp.]NCQ64257.1 hypothetical protein [Alphaproteobacteria bacterium]
MDGPTFSAGLITMGTGASAYFWPHKKYFESEDNRQRRLAELREGAPESYFEERRALEAYPPLGNQSNRTIRLMGRIAFMVGLCALVWSVVG